MRRPHRSVGTSSGSWTSNLGFDAPIEEVEWRVLSLPLANPIFLGTYPITEREYLWVRVRDERGRSGCAYAFTRGLPLDVVLGSVATLAVTSAYPDLSGFTSAVREHFRFAGPNGLVSRACSVLDVALWDLYGRSRGEPLWKILGAPANAVPLVAVVGYRRKNDPHDASQREIEEAQERGCWVVKIMTGNVMPGQDVEYVADVLRGYKGASAVWLDVNGAWPPGREAQQAARDLRDLGVRLIEEPYSSFAALQDLTDLKAEAGLQLAVGEFDHDLRVLCAYTDIGVDVIRPDATTIGGVTSWLALARAMKGKNIPVFPHFFPEVHAPLAAAVPNGLAAEMVPDWSTGLPLIARWPAWIEGERLRMPDTPGFGIDWDLDAIGRYTVRRQVVKTGE